LIAHFAKNDLATSAPIEGCINNDLRERHYRNILHLVVALWLNKFFVEKAFTSLASALLLLDASESNSMSRPRQTF